MGKTRAVIMVIVLTFTIIPFMPAFSHGGHEPPPVNLGGKQTSVFVKLDPPIVSGEEGKGVLLNVRFYDKATNENFREVTYRIWMIKDGQKILQEWFYHPQGDLTIKIVPKNTENVKVFGDREPQLNGLYNRGGPVVVEGPVFVKRGLHNLFIEIFSVGTTRTLVDPPLQFDAWVGLAYEEVYPVSYNGNSYDVKIRNFYDKIENFSFNTHTLTMQFATPFNWSKEFIDKVGMLHVEMLIPKAFSIFNSESLYGTVNGLPVPLFVDTYGEENVVVHYTISAQNLQNLANKLVDESSTDKAVFGIAPMEAEKREIVTMLNSQNYKMQVSWPEQILPDNPVPLALFFHDVNGNRIPSVTYDLILVKNGQQILNRNGVTTTEGFASHDIIFDSQGSVTMIIEKINGSDESVEMAINVVPEFPLGVLLAIAGAFGIYITLQRRARIL
ncbi:MAG: hypothetical protein QXU32_07140 [Nitrososphaerales archaeon]